MTACARLDLKPTHLVACLGGGSNALGLFLPYIDQEIALVGVEAGGEGLDSGRTAAQLSSPGILHGAKTMVLQDGEGQIQRPMVSAGLDYPGIGPIARSSCCCWQTPN